MNMHLRNHLPPRHRHKKGYDLKLQEELTERLLKGERVAEMACSTGISEATLYKWRLRAQIERNLTTDRSKMLPAKPKAVVDHQPKRLDTLESIRERLTEELGFKPTTDQTVQFLIKKAGI